MNSFESLFNQQRLHQQQHLRKERKFVDITLSPDSSCIICHPAPLPSALSTAFRSFLEWAKFILDARQYTGKTVENFQLAKVAVTIQLQQYFYKQTFRSLVYNKQPIYTFDQALQLIIRVHNETSAFSLPLDTDLSNYIDTSILNISYHPNPSPQPRNPSKMTKPAKTVTIRESSEPPRNDETLA